MTEAVKTIIYVAVAVVIGLVAIISYPRQSANQTPDLVGEVLFPKFAEPGSAARLRIVKFNEEQGEIAEFEVARDRRKGWVIPSSNDYPADAEGKMAEAATAFIGLKVIGLASEAAADQALYGVVEPNKDDLDASQEGVGLLVEIQGDDGQDLASLIIGKQVKGTEDQRFVRVPSQSAVHVVQIDPAKFPTDFEQWIEKDLLKINTFDIDKIRLKDYSILTAKTLEGTTVVTNFDERLDVTLRWDAGANEWKLDEFIEFRDRKPYPSQLLDDEELNGTRLTEMKNAFGDIKIVDVRKKPQGLGGDLKADRSFIEDSESRTSLIQRGFFPLQIEGSETELRSANGEIYVSTKDGVQYVLRFGEVASFEGSEGGINRYLFVTARLDDSYFPPLELTPLPSAGDAAPAPPKQPAENGGACQDEKKADEPTTAPDAAQSTESAQPSTQPPAKDQTELDAEIERIKKENQRKRDAREDELSKVRQQVNELNSRFAEWYYVISDEQYQKIHLGRNQIIQEKPADSTGGFNVDDFRTLQDAGLDGEIEAPVPAAPGGGLPGGGFPGGGLPPGFPGGR